MTERPASRFEKAQLVVLTWRLTLTRFAPQYVNEDLAAFVRNPKFDPTPWAAYSTGLQTQIMPLLQATAVMAGDMGEGCFDGIPIAVYEVGLACDVLAAVSLPSVTTEIRRVLGELDVYHDALEREWHADRQLTRDVARERILADSLAVLADRAIPSHLALSKWYTLGRAFGEFRWLAQNETPESLAPLRSLADAARQIGDQHLKSMPELKELAGLVNHLGGESEPGLRRLFVARIGLVGPLDELDPWEASPFLTNQIWKIGQQVNAHLQEITAVPTPPHAREGPRWHEAEGKLYFRGRCVREVATQAKNIRLILSCFQKGGWPDCVDTALKGEQRKDAIDSFNEIVCAVELYRAHREGAIGWRERPQE